MGYFIEEIDKNKAKRARKEKPLRLASAGYRAQCVSPASQVVIKVVSHVRFESVHRALSYISRKGELALETEMGDSLQSPDKIRAHYERWREDFEAGEKWSKRPPRHATHMILSAKCENNDRNAKLLMSAARQLLHESFAVEGYEYAFVLHRDTDHAHVHVIVNNYNKEKGKLRLNKPELEQLRTDFAKELTRRGIEAVATRRMDRPRTVAKVLSGSEKAKSDKTWYRAALAKIQAEHSTLGQHPENWLIKQMSRIDGMLAKQKPEEAASKERRVIAARIDKKREQLLKLAGRRPTAKSRERLMTLGVELRELSTELADSISRARLPAEGASTEAGRKLTFSETYISAVKRVEREHSDESGLVSPGRATSLLKQLQRIDDLSAAHSNDGAPEELHQKLDAAYEKNQERLLALSNKAPSPDTQVELKAIKAELQEIARGFADSLASHHAKKAAEQRESELVAIEVDLSKERFELIYRATNSRLEPNDAMQRFERIAELAARREILKRAEEDIVRQRLTPAALQVDIKREQLELLAHSSKMELPVLREKARRICTLIEHRKRIEQGEVQPRTVAEFDSRIEQDGLELRTLQLAGKLQPHEVRTQVEKLHLLIAERNKAALEEKADGRDSGGIEEQRKSSHELREEIASEWKDLEDLATTGFLIPKDAEERLRRIDHLSEQCERQEKIDLKSTTVVTPKEQSSERNPGERSFGFYQLRADAESTRRDGQPSRYSGERDPFKPGPGPSIDSLHQVPSRSLAVDGERSFEGLLPSAASVRGNASSDLRRAGNSLSDAGRLTAKSRYLSAIERAEALHSSPGVHKKKWLINLMGKVDSLSKAAKIELSNDSRNQIKAIRREIMDMSGRKPSQKSKERLLELGKALEAISGEITSSVLKGEGRSHRELLVERRARERLPELVEQHFSGALAQAEKQIRAQIKDPADIRQDLDSLNTFKKSVVSIPRTLGFDRSE